ncbi:MAG: LysR family transcriptional regulator [Pseudomonadota bacterium]
MSRAPKSTFVTFDMLRAFVSMAQTLNLSETAASLGLTRQTVRRHINDLEEFRGGSLFLLHKQSYKLTDLGEASLMGARSMLRQAESWAQGDTKKPTRSQHLEAARHINAAKEKYLSQQHPVSSVAFLGTPLVQRALKAWGAGMARIESPEMSDARPYLAIYRRSVAGWVCVEIGDQSTYARWFGWTWAKSAVGRLSDEDRAGAEYNRFISEAYDRIHGEGGVRFDHIFGYLPRESSERPVPVTFQRLLMGCVFPDGTPALAVLTSVTSQVDIDGLSAEDKMQVSQNLLEEFEGILTD